MDNLLATLNQGENTTPAWKKRYSQSSVSAKKQESDSINEYVDIKITGILIDQVTLPKMDGTQGGALYKVPFGLSARPSGTWEKYYSKLELSIPFYNHAPSANCQCGWENCGIERDYH